MVLPIATGLAAVALVMALLLGDTVVHRRHLRTTAEAGLQREIRDNNEGVQALRDSIPNETVNISGVVSELEEREAGRPIENKPLKIGINVVALTDAN